MEHTGNIYTSNHITQIKGELVKLKFLSEDGTSLTVKGKEYVRSHYGPFVVKSVGIRVQGIAKAGPVNVDINIDDFDNPSENTINIPSLSSNDVFALKVSGNSMRREGIFEGDYVIVEKQDSLWWPSPQDMIVTRYLPSDADYVAVSQISPSDYLGPVLKIYIKRVGENGCELGWRRFNEDNQYIIQALDLKPVGKVIGVYRNIERFTFPISSE